MMAFTHFLCFTCLAWVVVAVSPVERQVVSIHASGQVKSVIRRTKRAVGQGGSHASTFSGLLRTDRYSFHRGMNCSSGNGGDTIDSTMGMQLADCQKSCAHNDECTCVNFEPSSGKCGKQRYCHVEDCVPSALVDTYMMHSTFKVRSDKNKGGSLSEQVPQASFERSGGRMCTNATDLDTPASVVEDLSVTQCLTRCIQNPACTCVRFERYYQQECFLMANCPQPNFCTRTNRYDTYTEIGASPTEAYVEEFALGDRSCEDWRSAGDGQRDLGGPNWPNASATAAESLAACKRSCDADNACQYITWYEDLGCRTYTSCVAPVNDVPAVVKHIYRKQAQRR